MKTKQHKNSIITKHSFYSEVLAASLVRYAMDNKDFAVKLKEVSKFLPKRNTNLKYLIGGDVKMIEPQDEVSALNRVKWLAERIRKNDIPGTKEACSIISAWANEGQNTNPKQVVIGIVGLAIPGVTLGLIKRRKNLSVIVRDDITKNIDLGVAQKITKASHEVFLEALKLVDNDVNKIDPDVADWFFEDQKTIFYLAPREKMNVIEQELKRMHIIYGATEDKEGKTILAISPAVNMSNQESEWGIKRMEA